MALTPCYPTRRVCPNLCVQTYPSRRATAYTYSLESHTGASKRARVPHRARARERQEARGSTWEPATERGGARGRRRKREGGGEQASESTTGRRERQRGREGYAHTHTDTDTDTDTDIPRTWRRRYWQQEHLAALPNMQPLTPRCSAHKECFLYCSKTSSCLRNR